MAFLVGDPVKQLVWKNKEFVSFSQHTQSFILFFSLSFFVFFVFTDISGIFAESIIKAFILSVFVLPVLQFSVN